MTNMQTAAQGAPVMDEAAMAEMRRLIFEAPIQELADAQGISIDEAVQLRVEKNRSWRTPRAFPLTRPYSSGWRKTWRPPRCPSRCRCGPLSPRAS